MIGMTGATGFALRVIVLALATRLVVDGLKYLTEKYLRK